MKKTALKIFCLLLSFVLLMGVFMACDDEEGTDGKDPSEGSTPTPLTERERAIQLYRSVDEKMAAVNSYTVKVDLKLKTTKDGVSMSATGTENGYFVNLNNTAQFSHLSHSSIEMNATYNGQTLKMQNEMRTGYTNGKMFLSNEEKQDGAVLVDQKLYSSLSAPDYLAYLDEINDDEFDLSGNDFANITYKQNDDGTATATFSGVTSDALDKLPFFGDDIKDVFEKNKQPTDVVITLVVDANQYPKSLCFAFRFESNGVSTLSATTTAPELELSAAYSNINNTATIPAVDFSGFGSVGDLRVIEYANKAISARKEASSGNFETQTILAISGPGGTDRTDIKQQVHFATTNGRYTYRVEQNVDGEDYVYVYENDVLRQEGGDSMPYTDAEARNEIQKNMDPGDFAVTNVKSARLVSQTGTKRVCEFTFSNSDDAEALAESFNMNMQSFTAKVTVTIEDGQLTEYHYNLTVALKSGSRQGQVTLVGTVTF